MSEDSKASENLQGADLLRAIRQIEAGISIILPKLVEFHGTNKDTSYKREDLPINSVELAKGGSNYEIIDLTLEDSPLLSSTCSETSKNQYSTGNYTELTKSSKSYQETTLTEPLKQISQSLKLCRFILDQPQNVENVALLQDRELHCYTVKENNIIRNSQQDLARHPKNAYKTSKNISNKSKFLELLRCDNSYYLPKPVMRKSNYSRDANLEKRMAEKIERVKKKLEKPRSLKLLLLKEKNPLCRPVGRPRKITNKSKIQKVKRRIQTIGCANLLSCKQRMKSKNEIIFPVNAYNETASCSCNTTSSSKTNNSNDSIVTQKSSEMENPVDSEVQNSACATAMYKELREPKVTNQLPNLSTPMTNPTEVFRISSTLNVSPSLEVLPKPDVRLIEMKSNEALSSCSSDDSKKSSLEFSTSSIASLIVAPSNSVGIQEIGKQKTSTSSLEVESSIIADTKTDLSHTAKLDSLSMSVSTVASFSFESHLAKLSKKQMVGNSQISKSTVDQLSESTQAFPSGNTEIQETLRIINSVLVKSVTEEISKTDFVKRLEPNSFSESADDSKIQSVETASVNKDDNNKIQPLRSNLALPLMNIEKQTVNSVPSKSILEETLKTNTIEQSKSNSNGTTTALLEIMQKEDSVSNNIPQLTYKRTENQSNDSLSTGNIEYNVIRKFNGYSQLIVPCETGNTIISWKDPTIQDDVPSVIDSMYSQNSLQVKKPLIRVKNFSDMKENNVIMHDKASWHLPSPVHKVTDSLNTMSPDCNKDLILLNKNAAISYTDQTKTAIDNTMSVQSNQMQASEKIQSCTEPEPQTFHQSNTVSCSGEATIEDNNDSMVHSLLISGLQKKFDEFLFNILVYEMEKSPAAIIQDQKKINLHVDELQKAIDCFFKTCKSSAYFITVVENILRSTLGNFLKNYLSVEKYLKFVINVPSKFIHEVFKASGSSWEKILKNVIKDCFKQKKITKQRTMDKVSKTIPINKKRPTVEILKNNWSKSSVLGQLKHNTNIIRDQSCTDTLPVKKICGNPSIELPNTNQHKLNEANYCRLQSYLNTRYNYRNQAQPYGFISSQQSTPLLTHQEPYTYSNIKILQKDAQKYSSQTPSQAPQKLFKSSLAEQLQAQQRTTILSREIHQQNQSGAIISQQMGPQYQQQIKSGATIFQPKVPQYQQQNQFRTTSLQQVTPRYQPQNLSRSIISQQIPQNQQQIQFDSIISPQGVPQSHYSSNQSVSSFPVPVTRNSTPVSRTTSSCLAKLLQTRSISSAHNTSRTQSNSKLSCSQNYQKFQGCTQSKPNSNYLECGEFDNYSPINCMSAYPYNEQSLSTHSQIQFSSNLIENANVFNYCYQQTIPSGQIPYNSYADVYQSSTVSDNLYLQNGNINMNVNVSHQQNNHSNTGTRNVRDFPIQETFNHFGITNNVEQQPLSVNHINSSSASPDSSESPIFTNKTPPLHKPISVPVVQSSSKTPDISNNNTPDNLEDHKSKENYQKKPTENLVEKIKSTSGMIGFEQCDDLLNEFIDHTWADA